MSQEVIMFPASPCSGAELIARLADLFDSLLSNRMGNVRPTDVQVGETWLDSSGGVTAWVLKLWTGVVDIPILTINTDTGTVALAGSALTAGNADTVGGLAVSSFLRANANNAAATGLISTSSQIEAGRGSGGVSLTVNDGYGNANIGFNHRGGIPEVSGSAARIVANVDAETAGLTISLGDNAEAGVAKGLVSVLTLTTSEATLFGHKIWHAGNDGAGTGLDADTLDGKEAADFVLASEASSGLLDYVTSLTATAVAYLDFTSLDPGRYRVLVEDLYGTNGGVPFSMQAISGSAITASNYRYTYNFGSLVSSVSSIQLAAGKSTNLAASVQGHIDVDLGALSGAWFNVSGWFGMGGPYTTFGAYGANTAQMDGFRLLANTGTITGKFHLYKYVKI